MQSLLGILCLIALGWCISLDRGKIQWRIVLKGLALQWILAFLILKTSFGGFFFDGAQVFVSNLIEIAKGAGKGVLGESALGLDGSPAILGAVVIVTVVFFSAMFALFQHLGLVRLLVIQIIHLQYY